MRNPLLCLLSCLALVTPVLAADMPDGLPADAMIDAHTPNKTLMPRVVPNSGLLEWVPFQRDLTPWVTLSHLDRRDAVRPKQTVLVEPLAGDPKRGRDIALGKSRGNCVACHQLPDDEWPGTVGNSLLHYQRYGYKDAQIYQQIFDARIFNPHTVMPPYGSNNLLSEQDIRDLVAYLQSIE